jgi:hypothetical protein
LLTSPAKLVLEGTLIMKFSQHPRPAPLPGGPPPLEDPDNPAHFPVEPDDGSMPPPARPEDEGLGWKPQV